MLVPDSPRDDSSIQVTVETIDEVIGAGSAAVLKLDVEGFEQSVLRGARAALDQRRIRHIVFEDHHRTASPGVERLRAAGYLLFSLGWSRRGIVVRPIEDGSLEKHYEAPNFIATTGTPPIPRPAPVRCPFSWISPFRNQKCSLVIHPVEPFQNNRKAARIAAWTGMCLAYRANAPRSLWPRSTDMSWISIVAAVVLAILAIPAAARAQVVAREVAVAALADASDFVDLHDDYRAAASVGDAKALTRLFADDGVLVATDREVVRGSEALSSYFSNAFGAASSAPTISFTRTSAENRNGFGSETGRFEERLTGPDGGITRVSGVYVTIYRRDPSGRWRIAIEIRSRGDQQPLGSW